MLLCYDTTNDKAYQYALYICSVGVGKHTVKVKTAWIILYFKLLQQCLWMTPQDDFIQKKANLYWSEHIKISPMVSSGEQQQSPLKNKYIIVHK